MRSVGAPDEDAHHGREGPVEILKDGRQDEGQPIEGLVGIDRQGDRVALLPRAGVR